MKFHPDYIESLELFHPDIAFTVQPVIDPDWFEKELQIGPNRPIDWALRPHLWHVLPQEIIKVVHKPSGLSGLSLTEDSYIRSHMLRGAKALDSLKITMRWVSR